MKRLIKGCVLLLLLFVAAIAIVAFWWANRLHAIAERRKEIAADWSAPKVDAWSFSHSYNADKSKLLVWYWYSVTQTAPLKYPYYDWEGTGWQNKVVSRKHVIAAGRDIAIWDIEKKELSFPQFVNLPGYPKLAEMDGYTDQPALNIFASRQDFAVVTHHHIYSVSATDVPILFSVVAEHGTISDVTHLAGEQRVLFCVRKNRDVQCASLDLNSRVVTTLYTFDVPKRGTPIKVVHLDPNPARTIIVNTSISRGNHGTLRIGVDGTIRILKPDSMVEGTTEYSWYKSPTSQELILTFLPQDVVWRLNLKDASVTLSTESARDVLPRQATSIPEPAEWREPVTEHIVKTFLGPPGSRNLYPSKIEKE